MYSIRLSVRPIPANRKGNNQKQGKCLRLQFISPTSMKKQSMFNPKRLRSHNTMASETSQKQDCAPANVATHRLPLLQKKCQLTSYRSIKPEITLRLNQNTRNRILLIFTKAHYHFNLRYETLLMAFGIYQQTRSLVNEDVLGEGYYTASCLNLAVKYQEIYPPSLKQIFHLLKMHQHSFTTYIQKEQQVLSMMDCNLNIKNPMVQLKTYLKGKPTQYRHNVLYLLELAMFNPNVSEEHTWDQITASIKYIFSSIKDSFTQITQFEGVDWNVLENCARKLVVSQTYAEERHQWLYSKYCSSKYMSVASKGIRLNSGGV